MSVSRTWPALITSTLVVTVSLVAPGTAAAAPDTPEPGVPGPSSGAPPPADAPGNCAGADGSWYRGSDGGNVEAHQEIVGGACYDRAGDRATVTYQWKSVGPAQQGSMTFQLYDCTANVVEPPMTYTLQLRRDPPSQGGTGHQMFAVKPGHQYKPQVFGEGAYDRTEVAEGAATTGFFSRTGTPAFTGDGHCQ